MLGARLRVMLLMALCQPLISLAYAQVALKAGDFEVASIRPSKDAQGSALVQATPGRLTMTNISLHRILVIAYGLEDFQLAGEPSWSESKRYDLTATASDNASVEEMERPMLQAFLQERFTMKAHRESRVLPLYELVLSKGNSKLHVSQAGSCAVYERNAQPSKSPPPGEPQPLYCGFHRTGSWLRPVLEGRGVSLAELAANVARSYNTSLGRDVVDRTGTSGTFDLHLTWSNDSEGARASDSTEEAPSIFEALQEQLGLTLRPAKGPVQVLVVDHIEMPSAN